MTTPRTMIGRASRAGISLRNAATRLLAQRHYHPSHVFVRDDRESWEALLLELLRPVVQSVTSHDGRMCLDGPTTSANGKRLDGMELFARTFLAFAMSVYGKGPNDLSSADEHMLAIYRSCLLDGIDPRHPGYWGARYSPQILVENGSIAAALLLTERRILATLTPDESNRVRSWFRRYVARRYQANNWQWFKVFAWLVLGALGDTIDRRDLDQAMATLDALHVGEGWYTDGRFPDGQVSLDYYNAWGMHLFGLLFVLLAGTRYPEYADTLRSRARDFLATYQYYLTPGHHPPYYGRSAAYRFASASVIGAGVLAGVVGDQRWLKRCAIDTVNQFLREKIFETNGRLTLGYYEEGRSGIDAYSGEGSPYWALTVFTLLMIPRDHPFWAVTTSHVQASCVRQAIPACGQMLIHNAGGHVILLTGRSVRNDQAGRYNSVAYSNLFLPDLDRRSLSNAVVFRNALTTGFRRTRYITACESNDERVLVTWSPDRSSGAVVENRLTPTDTGYAIRTIIEAGSRTGVYVGGFTVNAEDAGFQVIRSPRGVEVRHGNRVSRLTVESARAVSVRVGVRRARHVNPGATCSATPYVRLAGKGTIECAVTVDGYLD
jgi:hypothetical protein